MAHLLIAIYILCSLIIVVLGYLSQQNWQNKVIIGLAVLQAIMTIGLYVLGLGYKEDLISTITVTDQGSILFRGFGGLYDSLILQCNNLTPTEHQNMTTLTLQYGQGDGPTFQTRGYSSEASIPRQRPIPGFDESKEGFFGITIKEFAKDKTDFITNIYNVSDSST